MFYLNTDTHHIIFNFLERTKCLLEIYIGQANIMATFYLLSYETSA